MSEHSRFPFTPQNSFLGGHQPTTQLGQKYLAIYLVSHPLGQLQHIFLLFKQGFFQKENLDLSREFPLLSMFELGQKSLKFPAKIVKVAGLP